MWAAWRRVQPRVARVAAMLLLAGLAFRFIWLPLGQAVEQARQARATQLSAARQMAALARAWQILPTVPAVPAPAAARVPALLTERAEALGMDTDDWQVTAETGGARVRGEAGFDAWLALLADLQTHHAIRVIELQLESVGPGRVRVDALFGRSGG
jgi:type II secretory pathway component PulM